MASMSPSKGLSEPEYVLPIITIILQSRSYVEGPKALLTGWGKISEGGPWSRYLRKVRIPIVPDEECDNNVRIAKKKVKIMNIAIAGIPLFSRPTEYILTVS